MVKVKGKYAAGGNITIEKRLKNVAAQLSLWVGIGVVCVIILISLFLPCPTASQFLLFRIAISIGIASFAGALPGFFKLNHAGVLKIGTGLAVFVICYFANPATIVITDDCDPRSVLQGKVFFAGLPLAGVRVEAPNLNEYDITNSDGAFDIPYQNDLKLPVSFRFRFKAIDTVVHLDTIPGENTWLINLPDTIPRLNEASVNEMISKYLEDLEAEVIAEHRREMYRGEGKKSSLKEISSSYLAFEQIDAKYRNVIHFTNGFNTLTTHKSIRACGVRIDPMVPYSAYSLDSYEAYLYKDTLWQDQSKKSVFNDFGFLNKEPVEFKITELKRTDRIEYRAEVEVTNNIRYVKTKVQHTKSNSWVKFQKTVYKGTRPKEEFIIRYQDGEWQLFDTKE